MKLDPSKIPLCAIEVDGEANEKGNYHQWRALAPKPHKVSDKTDLHVAEAITKSTKASQFLIPFCGLLDPGLFEMVPEYLPDQTRFEAAKLQWSNATVCFQDMLMILEAQTLANTQSSPHALANFDVQTINQGLQISQLGQGIIPQKQEQREHRERTQETIEQDLGSGSNEAVDSHQSLRHRFGQLLAFKGLLDQNRNQTQQKRHRCQSSMTESQQQHMNNRADEEKPKKDQKRKDRREAAACTKGEKARKCEAPTSSTINNHREAGTTKKRRHKSSRSRS